MADIKELCQHVWSHYIAIDSKSLASRLRYCDVCNVSELVFEKEEEK